MARRKSKYVFTPARRTALRKARKISAMKRRSAPSRTTSTTGRKSSKLKSFGRGALAVGGAVAGTYIAYHTEDLIVHPQKIVSHGRAVGRFVSGANKAFRNRLNPPKIKPIDWSKRGYL